MNYIFYIAPFLISALLYVKKYQNNSLQEYMGIAKAIGVALLAGIFIRSFNAGAAMFCGRFIGRSSQHIFLLPSVECAMIMFSPFLPVVFLTMH